jgi:hypothetical protein
MKKSDLKNSISNPPAILREFQVKPKPSLYDMVQAIEQFRNQEKPLDIKPSARLYHGLKRP